MEYTIIFKIIIGVFILTLIGTTVFIIIGITYKPMPKQTFINSDIYPINPNPICKEEKITCKTDNDCSRCIDNVEIKCVEVEEIDENNKNITSKYCLPEKPEQGCNLKNGGLWAWTGWSSTDRMEWDCLCTYPEIAGGKGCELNPNVCNNGGTWSYDATQQKDSPPDETNCKCLDGFNKLVTNQESIGGKNNIGGVPFCVKVNKYTCNGKQMCETMYGNSTCKDCLDFNLDLPT